MTNFSDWLSFCLNELVKISDKEVFLVGGYLRERLLLKNSFDFDFTVYSNALEMARKLAYKTHGAYVLLDPERKTARVVWNKDKFGFELNFDIATIFGNNIENDLKHRDLTINAIAVELNSSVIEKILEPDYHFSKDELIDPSNGFDDLKNKLIRTFNEKNFLDDPLRMLRVFRFAAKLDFVIEPQTIIYIKKNSRLINNPAKERLLKELFSIFSAKNSFYQLQKMNDVRLLKYMFQNISFENSLKKVNILEEIFNNLADYFFYHHEINSYLNETLVLDHTKGTLLKFAIFFLEFKSEEINVAIYLTEIENLLKTFTFSSSEQQLILKCIRFAFQLEGYLSENLTRKKLYHFFKESKNDTLGILLIFYARVFNETDFEIKAKYDKINEILKYFIEDKILSKQPLLLDGNEIMKKFSLKSGPLIGNLLGLLQEAQAEKKITCYDEAINFITDYFENPEIKK